MNKKVLFSDTVHPALQFQLEKHGWKCIDGASWTKEKTIEEIQDYNGIVIRSRFKIDQTLLEKANNLKFIARAGAGMENIDTLTAERKGIVCINAPEGNRNAVAEHALGMLLALTNNLVKADREVRQGSWLREANRGTELDGKTIGIIGCGNTGSSFVKKLRGFEAEILINDPYIKIPEGMHPKQKQSELEDLFVNCDVISFHVPLNEDTLMMVNNDFLNAFKKPVYLLNTSRGKILNTETLTAAIEKGIVKGAALDVLEYESLSFENLASESLPPPYRKLLSFENVILSPHIAGWSVESHRKISEVLAEKILQHFR